MSNLPDIYDTTEADHWRSLTVDQLLADMAAQVWPDSNGEAVDGDYVSSIADDVLQTVYEDVMDRAVDQMQCGKVDECRAKAVFLAWLAWNLDVRLSPATLT